MFKFSECNAGVATWPVGRCTYIYIWYAGGYPPVYPHCFDDGRMDWSFSMNRSSTWQSCKKRISHLLTQTNPYHTRCIAYELFNSLCQFLKQISFLVSNCNCTCNLNMHNFMRCWFFNGKSKEKGYLHFHQIYKTSGPQERMECCKPSSIDLGSEFGMLGFPLVRGNWGRPRALKLLNCLEIKSQPTLGRSIAISVWLQQRFDGHSNGHANLLATSEACLKIIQDALEMIWSSRKLVVFCTSFSCWFGVKVNNLSQRWSRINLQSVLEVAFFLYCALYLPMLLRTPC